MLKLGSTYEIGLPAVCQNELRQIAGSNHKVIERKQEGGARLTLISLAIDFHDPVMIPQAPLSHTKPA